MKDNLLTKILGKTVDIDVAQTEAYKVLQGEFESFKTEANAVTEAYATQVGELTTALSKAGEVIEGLQASLDQANAKVAEVAEKAETIRIASRKEKIVAAVGEAQAENILLVTNELADEAFDKLVAALQGTAAIEAKSAMFTEIGVAAEVATPAVTGESKEMVLLKQKYPQGAQR